MRNSGPVIKTEDAFLRRNCCLSYIHQQGQQHQDGSACKHPPSSPGKETSIPADTADNRQSSQPSKSLDIIPGEISNRNDNSESNIQPPIVLPVYRPSDSRPTHDDLKLAKQGIHSYESKRLKLYTDIDPKIAKRLPAYIDAVYKAW